MASILDVVLDGRRQIVEHDQATLSRIVSYYEDVFAQIEQDVRRLEWQIQEAIRTGDFELSEAWIRRQTWYRELEGAIRVRLDELNRGLGVSLDYAQYEAIAIAGDSVIAFQRSIGRPLSGGVNTRAFERWVSATSPGSPLNEVLRKYGLDAEEQLLRRITEGIGRGRGSSSITREIMKSLGADAEQYKIARIVRTEVMRSYRGASSDMYDDLPDGLITEYEWVAAHSERTCAVCLALDGTRYPAYPQKQHVLCRCVAIAVVSSDIIPARAYQRTTGSQYFASLPERKQKLILGGDEALDLYRQGTPLSAWVGERESADWGKTVYQRSTRQVKGRVGAE